MPDEIGPHLLGRIYVPDERDYKLSTFLKSSNEPLDAALVSLLGSWEGKKTKAWAKLITERVQSLAPTPGPTPTPDPIPTPTPDPTPTPTDVVNWADAEPTLDQGNTGHCVGFGWAGWGDTLPFDDKYTNSDGDAIYYEAKIIDGEPGAENGSAVRSGAQAMVNRGRTGAYAFANGMDEIRAWLLGHGPVVFGSNWTDDMFTPDADGYVVPTGKVAGGHCYLCVGDDPHNNTLLFLNSWGPNWGANGRFKMTYGNAMTLLSQQGEACAALELAV